MTTEIDEITDAIMAQVGMHPRMPTWPEVRRKLMEVADKRGDWAGVPMLSEDLDLVLEPRYPYQLKKCKINEAEGDLIINRWWSNRYRCHVCVAETAAGKRYAALEPYNQGMMVINTVGASQVWDFKAEIKAQEKLASLITPYAFERYIMTGSFLETSPRSKITYVFRRLRPTLALKAGLDNEVKILAALCLHPIGFYRMSWGGAMTPSDEVCAHLLWMRGDEPKYWAQANQHEAYQPQSGL